MYTLTNFDIRQIIFCFLEYGILLKIPEDVRKYLPILLNQKCVQYTFRATQQYRPCVLIFIQFYYIFLFLQSSGRSWFIKRVKRGEASALARTGFSSFYLFLRTSIRQSKHVAELNKSRYIKFILLFCSECTINPCSINHLFV